MSRTVYRTCPLCEAMCGLSIELDGDRVAGVRGNPDDLISHGYLCPKGASLGGFDSDPERLDRPLVRQAGGGFRPVDWPEAFAAVAAGLQGVIATYGRDAVALYMGNPVIHTLALPLFMYPLRESLGTRNVYSSMTLDTMPKQVACGLMYGDPLAIPVPDVDRTDHLVILGANPVESHGSLWTAPDLPGRLKALRRRGGRLVVVDPRRTRTAALADRYVPIRPGTDPYLLFGMVHTVLAEGLDRLPDGVAGLDRLRALAEDFAPEAVAPVCGIDPDTIRTLAREFAGARAAAVYGRLGTCTTEFGTLTSWLIETLNVLTGNLDRPGGAMFGEAPHLARRPTEPFRTGRWTSRVRGLPEVLGELPTATLADEILTPGADRVRALVCVAGNLVLAAPNGERLDRALRGLDFMVAVDPYLNETSRHAHVILPPPRLLQSPHYDVVLTTRSIRRWARYSPAALALDAGRPSEAEILARLVLIARGKGIDADPATVDEELIGRMLAGACRAPGSPLAGRDPERLRAQLTGDSPVERRLDAMLRLGRYGDAFGLRPDGLTLRALAAAVNGVDLGPLRPRLADVLMTESGQIELCPQPIAADVVRLRVGLDRRRDGFVLIGRRQLRSVNSWSHNVPALSGGSNRCTLHVNPEDARVMGLVAGDEVRVRGRHGAVTVAVELTGDVMPGVVSLPYGWGHGRRGTRLSQAALTPGVSMNTLTDDLTVDPLSGTAVFNAVPVEVTPVRQP